MNNSFHLRSGHYLLPWGEEIFFGGGSLDCTVNERDAH